MLHKYSAMAGMQAWKKALLRHRRPSQQPRDRQRQGGRQRWAVHHHVSLTFHSMYCTLVRKLRYGRSTRSSPVSPPHQGLRLKWAYVLRSAKGMGLVPAARRRQGAAMGWWGHCWEQRSAAQGGSLPFSIPLEPAGSLAPLAASPRRAPPLTRIKQHAVVWLQQVGEAVKEPAVRVQLAPVGGLGGEHDLQRRVAVQARVLLVPAAGRDRGKAGWLSMMDTHRRGRLVSWLPGRRGASVACGCMRQPASQAAGHRQQGKAGWGQALHLAVYSNMCMDTGRPTACSCCRFSE